MAALADLTISSDNRKTTLNSLYMTEKDKTYRIFISAAEPSADAHCAGLINALKQTDNNIEFVGVGGAKMAEAGCELLETTAGKAVMVYNAFKHVFRYYKLIKRITGFLKTQRPDLVIVCDSPAFNFHIAKAAKKVGAKTLFYVAPQLWAWAPWRISKLRKSCDKLACILPFEEEWFAKREIDVTFVGNPLLDQLGSNLGRYRKKYNNFEPTKGKIALMPGSREAEINLLWPAMQKIAVRIKRKYPAVVFTAVAVDEQKKETLKSMQTVGFRCNYTIDSITEAALAADLSIVTSGSATLQVAAVGCPMVIMYQSSKFLWHLVGRWLVKTKYLSLVNILAEQQLVPEFMPYFSSIEPIVKSIESLLGDPNKLTQTSHDLIKLVKPLSQAKASEKVAGIVIDMLHK